MHILFIGIFTILTLISPPLAFSENDEFNELDCFIEPYMVVNIGSGIAGIIDKLYVDRDDFVKKGQILAKLDSRVEKATMELIRARSELKAKIELRSARLQFTEREYERNKEIYEKDIIAIHDMDEATTNMNIAGGELQEAMEENQIAGLEFKQSQAALERLTIRSPINAVVVERFLSPGELVTDQPILKLAQLHPLNVEVIAPVKLLGSVAVGDKAEVKPESPVGGDYYGTVKIVDRIVEGKSGTFGIRIELSNADFSLPVGLKCRVRFLEP